MLLVLFIVAMKVGGHTLLTLLSRRYRAKELAPGSGAIERSKCVGLLTEFLWQKVGWVCYTPPSFFFSIHIRRRVGYVRSVRKFCSLFDVYRGRPVEKAVENSQSLAPDRGRFCDIARSTFNFCSVLPQLAQILRQKSRGIIPGVYH